jgi:hypothetical protein
MQSRQKGPGKTGKTGKPRKKFKFTVQEVSGMSSINGSHLLLAAGKVSVRVCTGHLIDDRIAGDVAAYPSDESPNSDVPENAPMEAVLESADNATPVSQSANPALVLPPTDSSADPTPRRQPPYLPVIPQATRLPHKTIPPLSKQELRITPR